MSEIIIRDATLQDSKRLLEIYSFYVQKTAITFEYETPSLSEFAGRIKNISKRYPYLVVECDHKILGYAYASAFKDRKAYDWSCELSIYLEKNAHKKGLGRKLYTELEKRLKSMGILNLYACIAYPKDLNDPFLDLNSVHFHEHVGFKEVGKFHNCGFKFKRFYHMVWMEKLIGSFEGHIQEVKFYDLQVQQNPL